MLLYAVSRFVIEFYRGDERGMVGVFSTSQFISLLLAPLAIVMLVYLSRRTTPEPKRAKKAA
jgi:phosphatidylglycerol---prolipoprotein diacylglyceryl transferase